MLKKIMFLSFGLCLLSGVVFAQQPSDKNAPAKPAPVSGPSLTPPPAGHADSVLVTIILKHQQDKSLPELRRILEAQGFWEMFPPEEAKVLSWVLAMGIGHVIVLQLPAGSVRRLNLAIQNGAWSAFNSEIYLSYDYMPIWQDYIEKREEAKDDRN